MINCGSKLVEFLKDETERFRLAQFLFILSASFGWYIEDGYRRGLFLLALLLLDKSHRKLGVARKWKGMQKFAGVIFCAFAAWIFIVPLIFGVEPLDYRIAKLARPLEIALHVMGVMIFARDGVFEKRLYICSVASASLFTFLTFVKRLSVSFSIETEGWIFSMRPEFAGIILLCLTPWLFYSLLDGNCFGDRRKKLLCACILLLSSISLFATYYRTIWLAAVAQAATFLLLAKIIFKVKFADHMKAIIAIGLLFAFGIVCVYSASSEAKNKIDDRINRLTAIGRDFGKLSSNRGKIWQEACTLISKRPVAGYGWTEYNKYAKIKLFNAHSSYLEAAFHVGVPGAVLYAGSLVSFFILALMRLHARKGSAPAAFAAALMITSTIFGGIPTAYFFVNRVYLIPFWSTLSILLSPLYFNGESE